MRNFRDLNIWQDSIDLVTIIYSIVKKLPVDERFGLCSQMTRAAVSIPSNIAEGCRGSDKELIQFLNISLGSAFELETQLTIAKNLNYIDNLEFEDLMSNLSILQKQINSFRSSIKGNAS